MTYLYYDTSLCDWMEWKMHSQLVFTRKLSNAGENWMLIDGQP